MAVLASSLAEPGRTLGFLLLAGFLLGGAGPAAALPGGVPAAELEVALAQVSAPYLVVDPAAAEISVRLRGRTVETVPLQSFLVLRASALGKTPAPLELPAVWRVAARPPSRRAFKAPPSLTAGSELPAPEAPAPAAAEETAPPDAYSFPTKEGWWVEIGRPQPAPGAFARWRQAVAGGWTTLKGEKRSSPDRLLLGVSPEGARRLHHLFRKDAALLLVAPEPTGP